MGGFEKKLDFFMIQPEKDFLQMMTKVLIFKQM